MHACILNLALIDRLSGRSACHGVCTCFAEFGASVGREAFSQNLGPNAMHIFGHMYEAFKDEAIRKPTPAA